MRICCETIAKSKIASSYTERSLQGSNPLDSRPSTFSFTFTFRLRSRAFIGRRKGWDLNPRCFSADPLSERAQIAFSPSALEQDQL